ncbi:hypothetical protein QQ045_002474 [Rhodiola kirilowii]
MEEITEKVSKISIDDNSQKRNRIQVSNTKKPLFFYVNLAKRYMQQYNEVELCALGMAISTVVTITEILKNNGFAIEKSKLSGMKFSVKQLTFPLLNCIAIFFTEIATSTVDIKDESRYRPVQKAKIEILLGKSEKFDELMAAAAEEKAALDAEGHS